MIKGISNWGAGESGRGWPRGVLDGDFAVEIAKPGWSGPVFSRDRCDFCTDLQEIAACVLNPIVLNFGGAWRDGESRGLALWRTCKTR